MVVAPLFASLFIPILGWRAKRLCYPFAIIAVLISLLSSLIVAKSVVNHGHIQYFMGGWNPPWGIEFYVDHLNAFVAVVVTFISLLGAIFSKKNVKRTFQTRKVLFILCFFCSLRAFSASS
jgi:multicomponent Na+:H+ antiporter subunit D